MLPKTYHYLLAHKVSRDLLLFDYLALDYVINAVEFIYQEFIDQVIRIMLLKELNANCNSY